MCIQKITFWLNLPRKLDEFFAFLKSTILTQKMFLKSIFLTKNLQRVRFSIQIFETCKILKQKL